MEKSTGWCAFLNWNTVLSVVLNTQPQRSIYNRITQDEEFKDFADLIHFNGVARVDLLQRELTIFVPIKTNVAFQSYKKPLHSDLAFYHMASGVWPLKHLQTTRNISSIKDGLPKLWMTKANDSLFINNAEIIQFRSDYNGQTGNNLVGKQVMHLIDDVLDPIIHHSEYSYTAYDFLTSIEKWKLGSQITVANYLHKIREFHLEHLYRSPGTNTYFIPIDTGIDPQKFNMFNKDIIFGHIVPLMVLFTRPTEKGRNYETMANGDDVYIVLSFEDIDNKLFIKGTTVHGTTETPNGEVLAEIVQANIPVDNGVVHIISLPIGIFKRKLKLFPYLPVLDKLAADPELSTVYEMGEETGFNKIFETNNGQFTYFVPIDYAWRQMKANRYKYNLNNVDLLKRHLIVSEHPYTMENLFAISSGRNFTNIDLQTTGETIRLLVLKFGKHFYIKWKNLYIKVVRPNWDCTNGIIHMLAGPMVELKRPFI
ncbi:fasciclin-1-like isoform X2 [Anthonomus grandis grandis]|uniref:fasciclin-1-like isoform X2 n=1 Tax=Anthonomus grandis grandis TaxID=2921223 RepID=UPI0021664E0A|nr:fasciclin-1-like isoform X2 [Anthonomus grandis grandis]